MTNFLITVVTATAIVVVDTLIGQAVGIDPYHLVAVTALVFAVSHSHHHDAHR